MFIKFVFFIFSFSLFSMNYELVKNEYNPNQRSLRISLDENKGFEYCELLKSKLKKSIETKQQLYICDDLSGLPIIEHFDKIIFKNRNININEVANINIMNHKYLNGQSGVYATQDIPVNTMFEFCGIVLSATKDGENFYLENINFDLFDCDHHYSCSLLDENQYKKYREEFLKIKEESTKKYTIYNKKFYSKPGFINFSENFYNIDSFFAYLVNFDHTRELVYFEPVLILFACKDIKKDEELLWHYGFHSKDKINKFFDNNEIKNLCPQGILCHCGKIGNKWCGSCKGSFYCSLDCQKKDWKRHKLTCKKHSN